MGDPKRHHFVPASYLQGFVEKDTGFLHVYSRRSCMWRRQKPDQVMVRNKFYHQDWAPSGIDKNVLEKMLGSELEPQGLNALNKLVELPESLDDQDSADILNYLQFQRIRVPRQADMAKSLVKSAITLQMMETPHGREALKHGAVVIKDSFRFEFMRNLLGALTPYFSRMIWKIVESEQDSSFITSDSPVSFYNLDFIPPTEAGVGLYGTRVLFPINKRFLLVMSHGEYEKGEKNASEALPRDIQVEDGLIEIQRGTVWNKETVRRHNWLMFQLSQDVVVGESKEILSAAIDKELVGHT